MNLIKNSRQSPFRNYLSSLVIYPSIMQSKNTRTLLVNTKHVSYTANRVPSGYYSYLLLVLLLLRNLIGLPINLALVRATITNWNCTMPRNVFVVKSPRAGPGLSAGEGISSNAACAVMGNDRSDV